MALKGNSEKLMAESRCYLFGFKKLKFLRASNLLNVTYRDKIEPWGTFYLRNTEFLISIELEIITVHSTVGVHQKRFDWL